MRQLYLAFGLPLLAACAEQDRTQTHAIGEPIDRVLVDVDHGDVHVQGGDPGPSQVDVLSSWRSRRAPEVEVWASHGTLHVEADCPELAVCETELFLSIPAEAQIEVDARTADVELDGVRGSVLAEVTTGRIEGFELGSAEVEARTVTGSIDLRFVAGAFDVGARTTTGNIELTVPDRAYDVEAQVTTGDVDVRVDTSADADATLRARVVTGNVTVRAD